MRLRLFPAACALASLASVALVSAPLDAQGAIAVQGFGYPTGQLSAAALGGGGAGAELDPASPINPATVASGARYSIYSQVEPETRRTTAGTDRASARVVRFPIFSATGAVGPVSFGASFSTFLDRTFSNAYADNQVVAGETLPSVLGASSNGAMTDARFAVAMQLLPQVQVGAAVHAIVGENRIAFGRSFPDSSGLGSVEQSSVLSYGGRALSLGIVAAPIKSLVVGASLRTSGPLSVRQDDASLASARVPSRLGIGASYVGIPNTALSARIERVRWSQMDALGTAAMSTFDATEIGAGLEVAGPKVAGIASLVRLGVRDRTLPFGVGTAVVDERAFSGGFGVPVSRGRGQVDLAVQRASRRTDGATERAWLVSLGFGIRP
ncbi:MAG: hypothetical protein FJ361_03990 [Gemmatimonadetes bacterium]|nr:hypothetical protein [Gemmatimonadota bacterium]